MPEIKEKYPFIIIGAGPAGLTASIYASRYRIGHLIIGEALGGLAFEAHKICNFPTEKEISGLEIVRKMKEHVESFGTSLLMGKVIRIGRENGVFKITTQKEETFTAEAVLLATGTEHRRLNLPNEEKFIGKGVSYCATCDAMFYKDKIVAVIGGSNSATTASLYLAEIAKKVYQIYRRDKLRGETLWIEQALDNEKIEIIYNTEVIGLKGKDRLEEIVLSAPHQGKRELLVDGLFVEIGTNPKKELIENLSLETNESGYIKVGPDQKTSQEGVWAAGDITTGSNDFRQIITACSEGAVAAESIFKFLQQRKQNPVAE